MSDFDNKNNNGKDYDLDYFMSSKSKNEPEISDDDYTLASFNTDKSISNEDAFIGYGEPKAEEAFSLSSFGKKRKSSLTTVNPPSPESKTPIALLSAK